jgi:tRNA dimethylallyltransferase
MLPKIVIICGPTAAGKTQVGIELARRYEGEIISADSQQVWRGFDIGTAKANLTSRSSISHHLIDVAEPDERFDAARYVELADAAIADIVVRGRPPFVVGGTGMYIRMLVHGLCQAPPRDADFRAALEAKIGGGGLSGLWEMLGQIDPDSAKVIHPNDRTRIIRALEIHHLTGHPASSLRRGHRFRNRRYEALKIGLNVDRAELYRRIDERVDRMMEEGLLGEVRRLLARYDQSCQPFAGVGYRELVSHINGRLALREAVGLTKRNSRHLAKRQLTWFRADPEVRWFDPEQVGEMAKLVKEFLKI